jgi:hypothetical protein
VTWITSDRFASRRLARDRGARWRRAARRNLLTMSARTRADIGLAGRDTTANQLGHLCGDAHDARNAASVARILSTTVYQKHASRRGSTAKEYRNDSIVPLFIDTTERYRLFL